MTGPQEFPEGSFLQGARCSGRYCDNMQFYVCDVKQNCVVEGKADGFWRYDTTIPGTLQVKMRWGVTKGTENTKTTEWQDSMTASISEGFNILVLSGEASISRTQARREAETFKEAWTSTTVRERTITFQESNIGDALWKWEFTAKDTCGDRSTVVVNDYALTEGRWREPCCLPGYGISERYKKCASSGTLISSNPSCSVGLFSSAALGVNSSNMVNASATSEAKEHDGDRRLSASLAGGEERQSEARQSEPAFLV